MKKIRINITAIAFCLYLASVALLCFMHGDDIPRVTGTWFGLPADKVAHLIMFFPFIPLAFFSIWRKDRHIGVDMTIVTGLLILGAGTAYLTEIIQEKLSYRAYEIKDFMSDCIGLANGYVIIVAYIILRKLRKRH